MPTIAPARPDQYDVLVIGAGPVGLATARFLAMNGTSVGLIDSNRVACQHPRATHIDDETMRTLQLLGAADLEPGYLRMSGWELTGPDDKAFLKLTMPDDESDQAWHADYQFHQPDFESRQRGLLVQDPQVSLWFGWDVTEIHQDDERVTVTIVDRTTGGTHTLRAAYLVGADGARSFVRDVMGVEVEDLHGTQRSLIVDISPFQHPAGLPKRTGFVRCEAELPVTYCPIGPPRLRFEFMLADGQDASEMERPDVVMNLLSRWAEPGSYRILRTDTYEWHALLVRGWRRGRLLLAGDAAHTMPPLLGQGMCSGIRDALNLAWKLSGVVSGRYPESLLDTYESERSPHVLPYIAESARQSNMIEAFGHGELPPSVDEEQIVERYRPLLGSGLVAESTGAIGQLAPQPRGDDGERLDDISGYRFTVVGLPEVLSAVGEATRRLWEDLDVVVLSSTGAVVRGWLADHSAAAAIIRPDRYAYAVVPDCSSLEEATRILAARLLSSAVLA